MGRAEGDKAGPYLPGYGGLSRLAGEAKRVVGWPREDEGQGQRKPVLVPASPGPTPTGYLLM